MEHFRRLWIARRPTEKKKRTEEEQSNHSDLEGADLGFDSAILVSVIGDLQTQLHVLHLVLMSEKGWSVKRARVGFDAVQSAAQQIMVLIACLSDCIAHINNDSATDGLCAQVSKLKVTAQRAAAHLRTASDSNVLLYLIPTDLVPDESWSARDFAQVANFCMRELRNNSQR